MNYLLVIIWFLIIFFLSCLFIKCKQDNKKSSVNIVNNKSDMGCNKKDDYINKFPNTVVSYIQGLTGSKGVGLKINQLTCDDLNMECGHEDSIANVESKEQCMDICTGAGNQCKSIYHDPELKNCYLWQEKYSQDGNTLRYQPTQYTGYTANKSI